MNTMSIAEEMAALRTPQQLLMDRAFKLVCPHERMRVRVEKGLMPASAMEHSSASWKAPIGELVTDDALAAAGVTIEQVRESIIFFTATVPVISREQIGGMDGEKFNPAKPGYFVRAAGYAAGPAGDY